MNSRPFGSLPSGESIEVCTLSNASGASVEVLTLGGIVRSLRVPDRQGRMADVVLGFNELPGYVADHPYFGAIIGRIAGRVTGGKLHLAGRTHALDCNNGPNHLHGGRVGLDKRVWSAKPAPRPDGASSVRLTYRSPDGEEGYPGNLDLAITYTLTAENALVMETEAIADQLTPLSLAQHSYFNLTGEGTGSVLDHEIEIHARKCIPARDAEFTLSGRAEPVPGRGNDFNLLRRLGDALPQLFMAHGELYLLRETGANPPNTPTMAARVVERQSGRVLEVFTDESCLQFYSGVSLDGTFVGKSGRAYGPHAGFCLECQGYPDGASQPWFGDILVHPGQVQRRTTIYAFSAD